MKLSTLLLYKNIDKYYEKKKQSLFGSPHKELRLYEKNYLKMELRPFKQTSLTKLYHDVQKVSITYIADYHTFEQNVVTLKDILHFLIQKNIRPIIGLEMVLSKHQNDLNAFVNRDITELEFLEQINYSKSWHFPWNHYKKIFDLAREQQLQLYALNSIGTLKERDIHAAKIISSIHLKDPNKKILILFGETHMAANKLPLLVNQYLPHQLSSKKPVILHQNMKHVYWKLGKKSNKTALVTFKDKEYCLINSPPWTKTESLVYWYENFLDDPDFDIHEHLIETGLKALGNHSESHFQHLVFQLLRFYQLESLYDKNEIESFNLYDHLSIDFILKTIHSLKDERIKNFYSELVTHGEEICVPYKKIYYLSNYSYNSLAIMAGLHIFNITQHIDICDFHKIINKKSHFFKYLFQMHLQAQFASKIMNPHRKSDMYKEMKESSPKHHLHILYQKMIIFIDHKTLFSELLHKKNHYFCYMFFKILARFTIELTYEAVMKNAKKYRFDFFQDFLLSKDISIDIIHDYFFVILKHHQYEKSQRV